jgi:uncharacterized YccA/Bax inhibitor family protein
MANAMLNDKTFSIAAGGGAAAAGAAMGTATAATRAETGAKTMTIGGTSLKASLLVAIALAAGTVGWNNVGTILQPSSALIFLVVYLGLIGMTFVAAKNPGLAIVIGPIYAVVTGVWGGAISQVYNAQYAGIVLQALLATVSVMLVTLVLYSFRIVRVSSRFIQVVVAATFGVLFLYLALFVLQFFGINALGSGWIGLAISAVTATVAAFNLFLDYHFIEVGVNEGAPASMEWYAAFGLLATLVWLYFEILRLLSYFRD